VRNNMMFSRRAIRTIQTMGHFWTKHVPGRRMGDNSQIDELRFNAALAKRNRKLEVVRGRRA
jgi:hypothetical protein